MPWTSHGLATSQGQTLGSPQPTIALLLSTHSPEIQLLALRLRGLIREALPHLLESPRPGWRAITYGPTIEPRGIRCYLAPRVDHVELGFPHGSALPDHDSLLSGTGPSLRRAIMVPGHLIPTPALASLLRAAGAQVS